MPRFIITSRAAETTVDLVLDNGEGIQAIVDSRAYGTGDTLFALRVGIGAMWQKYCYASLDEGAPCPPIPPIEWSHVP